MNQISEQLLESEWGSWVDRSEWMTDTPEWGYGTGMGSFYGPLPSSMLDRRDGAFFPVFRTEQELAQIRGDCHVAGYFSSIAIGAVEALQRYVFGKGFTFDAEVQADHGLTVDATNLTRLVAEVKVVIREFEQQNNLTICSGIGSLDCEIDSRIRHDGEAPIILESRLAPGGVTYGTSGIGVKVQLVEPDQVTQPADTWKLDRWLGLLDRVPTSWSFGVHTPSRYLDEVLGLHVVYDGVGDEWDYIPNVVGHPANPRKTCVFAKRNTPRNVKRGLGDFFPIVGDIGREAKLEVRLAKGATLQASIAWVTEQPANINPSATNPANIQPLRGHMSVPTQDGTRQLPVSNYPAGSIVVTPAGRKFLPGPMGAERNPNFLLIANYMLRRIGVRWNTPEYMISGDASNANYSSTLVAESPFVKAREFDQQFHIGVFQQMLWKVLEFYAAAGRFRRLCPDFATLKRLIKVIVTAPEVATRDPQKMAETLATHQDKGWASPETCATKAGYDYQAEQAKGLQPVANPATPGTGADASTPPPAGGEFANTSTLQWRRNVKAIDSTLDRFKSGEITRDHAHVMLTAAGLAADRADRLLDGQPDPEVDQAVAAEDSADSTRESTKPATLAVNDLMANPWKGYP